MFFHSNLPSTVLCDNFLAHGADDISPSVALVQMSRLMKHLSHPLSPSYCQGARLGSCSALCQSQDVLATGLRDQQGHGEPPTTRVHSLSAEREVRMYPTHSGHFVWFREVVLECRRKSLSCPGSGREKPSS